jgi:hypothetical protein
MTRSSTERQSRVAAGERVREALSRPRWRAQWKKVEQLRERHGPGTPPASLPDWHTLGRFVSGVMGSSLSTVKGAAQGLAELIGSSPWEIQTSRLFAAEYSAEDVKKTVEKAQRLRRRFGWSHMRILLSVPDKEFRRALQNECIANGWSVKNLTDQIRIRSPSGHNLRGQVGRRPERPTSLGEALAEFERLSTRLVRWYDSLKPAPTSETTETPKGAGRRHVPETVFDADQFPRDLRPEIEKTIRRLETLVNEVRGAMTMIETDSRRSGRSGSGR